MIVYREQEYQDSPRAHLDDCDRAITAASRQYLPSSDTLLHLLIEAGELAAAVADVESESQDGPHHASDMLRDLLTKIAVAAVAGWRGDRDGVHHGLDAAAKAVRSCTAACLPPQAPFRVSEGFAYYALAPELYALAARAWRTEVTPRTVWCLGLRTIGLTLAATAAAALQGDGVDARVRSVRPRGHPFARHVSLDHALSNELRPAAGTWWLVIDEGPGLSGSSIAAAAAALSALGAADDRIVLMPAHSPSVERFHSDEVRRRWRRHSVRPVDDHAAALNSNSLSRQSVSDISAGAWRERRADTGNVAVHPHHERRKYRSRTPSGDRFIKFVGYGRYGVTAVRRARAAAEAGWGPFPQRVHDGWAEFEWIDAAVPRAVESSDSVPLLADYLSFVRRTWSTTKSAAPERLIEMTSHNLRELSFNGEAAKFEKLWQTSDAPAVHLDARLRPHEWLWRGEQFIKTDGFEHHDDHFFPGPTDIAWDLAGAIDEWDLEPAAAAALVNQYATQTGDRAVVQRLPFYRVAYLAFRSGYTAFGSRDLAGTPDGDRFDREHQHYRARLQHVLDRLPGAA